MASSRTTICVPSKDAEKFELHIPRSEATDDVSPVCGDSTLEPSKHPCPSLISETGLPPSLDPGILANASHPSVTTAALALTWQVDIEVLVIQVERLLRAASLPSAHRERLAAEAHYPGKKGSEELV